MSGPFSYSQITSAQLEGKSSDPAKFPGRNEGGLRGNLAELTLHCGLRACGPLSAGEGG